MNKVTVLIIEDSRVVSEFLSHIINRDSRLEVLGVVRSGEEALKALEELRPDVISMDIRLPGMNGLEATKRIMSSYPTPIVVVSSDVEDDELNISMNALRAGALAVVQKPVGLSHADYEMLADGLCTKLYIMSQVRVIRQRYRGEEAPAARATNPALEPPAQPLRERPRVRPRVLGIVASTGGPSALVKVLGDLKPDFPAPIVIVQHITPGFVRGFIRWLDDVLPHFRVVEAGSDALMVAGTIYVAPAECHTVCTGPRQLRLSDDKPVSTQKPSGTVLFNSLAKFAGPEAIGVLLTGMGEDGATGLLAMRQAGAYTIAEHQSSAVVYGMPAAAVRMGAAKDILPLSQIGPRLNELFFGTPHIEP